MLWCLAGTKVDPYCFQRKHRDGLIRLVIQAHPDSWRVSWRPVQIIPPNGLGLGQYVGGLPLLLRLAGGVLCRNTGQVRLKRWRNIVDATQDYEYFCTYHRQIIHWGVTAPARQHLNTCVWLELSFSPTWVPLEIVPKASILIVLPSHILFSNPQFQFKFWEIHGKRWVLYVLKSWKVHKHPWTLSLVCLNNSLGHNNTGTPALKRLRMPWNEFLLDVSTTRNRHSTTIFVNCTFIIHRDPDVVSWFYKTSKKSSEQRSCQ